MSAGEPQAAGQAAVFRQAHGHPGSGTAGAGGSAPAGRPARPIGRRSLLQYAAAGSGLLLLAGCTAPAAPKAAAGERRQAAAVPHRAGRDAAAATKPAPVLPARRGDVLGGPVTVEGRGLSAVRGLRFGAVDAAVQKVSAGSLRVVIPPAADYQPATVPVTMRTAAGVTGLGDYTYAALSPVGRQMAYALAHWKHYNLAEYGSLNSVGGDCANFVSQGLVARGWRMNTLWHNHDAGAQWTPVWGYVPAMDNYFLAHGADLGLERLGEHERAKVALGDIGIFDWHDNGDRDHVEVVDRITHRPDGTIAVAFASHNLDYAYRDLDATITQEHPGAAMHFWHFADPQAVGGFRDKA